MYQVRYAFLTLRSVSATDLLVVVAVLCVNFLCNTVGNAQSVRPPNVIVVYTDDHGYSDLGCQGVFDDVKTPHIDALAAGGVRMANGYCTAPQCVPSRGGLLSGQYQNRFGLESNPDLQDASVMKRFDAVTTLPERLRKAGYTTGMAGKWHLGPDHQITDHGFDQAFFKHSNAPGFWNMNLDGQSIEPTQQNGGGYHIDLISDFACAFIERYQKQPFFFYLACRAPHVPLDAPPKYLERFPGEMPERRRQALAMISAVDDGVGRIVQTLREHGLEENTLLLVISDNGAPLKKTKADEPGGGPGWDGSLNDPLNGEKGMLTEGGVHVPFVVHWKDTIPGGQVYTHPVISLDVAATATAIAGLEPDPALAGVNLVPYLNGAVTGAPHESLYWRWLNQSAIRQGKWKYIELDDRKYLFDLETDLEETTNVVAKHPDVAASLHDALAKWADTLLAPGIGALASDGRSKVDGDYYDWYIDGKRDEAEKAMPAKKTPSRSKTEAKVTTRDLFTRRDVNKDGRVTLAEFLAGRTGPTVPVLTRRFAELDQDRDGDWESEELEPTKSNATRN